MKYEVNLVKPTKRPKQKKVYITMSEYEEMNPKGYKNLIQTLIVNMVKFKYKS